VREGGGGREGGAGRGRQGGGGREGGEGEGEASNYCCLSLSYLGEVRGAQQVGDVGHRLGGEDLQRSWLHFQELQPIDLVVRVKG
jgi:hypothetical protein